MPGRNVRAQLKVLTSMIYRVFHLPRTGRLIFETLLSEETALSVKDLVRKVGRSERSVRGAIEDLVKKNILIRKVSITGRKRLAYLYSIGPIDRIIKVVRGEILNQLETLERVEGM